jgi:hypothetical protein
MEPGVGPFGWWMADRLRSTEPVADTEPGDRSSQDTVHQLVPAGLGSGWGKMKNVAIRATAAVGSLVALVAVTGAGVKWSMIIDFLGL